MREPVVVTGIEADALDVAHLLEHFGSEECGGVVVFEGRARAATGGRAVVRLEYEAYEALARRQLHDIAEETAVRHQVRAVLAVHRVGPVLVGQPAVVVAAAAPHRGEAFSAADELISRIKAEAAFWKREVFAEGGTWVGLDAPTAPVT